MSIGDFCPWPRRIARYEVMRRPDCNPETPAEHVGCAYDIAGAQDIIGSWRRWCEPSTWYWDVIGIPIS